MAALDVERLAARVRTAARADGLIETAQVKLLGLDAVRAAAGARWPRMREYVRERSLRIIADRIGADDAVIPCGDGFLVVFADATVQQTQAHCREINEALIGFYLGEEALRDLTAVVHAETVSASALAGLVNEKSATAEIGQRRNQLKLGRFWPMWSTRHLAVAAYVCGPALDDGASMRLGYGRGFLERGVHLDRDFLDVDLCMLEQACAAAEQSSAPVGVSVHATTMQVRKTREIYLAHLNANASSAQQRMFISIAEIEPGAPLMSLTEWTTALKHYVPRVALDLHHSDRAIGALASTGAWAASFHLPVTRIASSADARAALNQIDAWCRNLRRQGLMPIINGFQDAALLDLASYSDLAFATGEKLWASRSEGAGVEMATRRRRAPVLEQAA